MTVKPRTGLFLLLVAGLWQPACGRPLQGPIDGGGSGGAGGGGGSLPGAGGRGGGGDATCTSSADCRLYSDCCSCVALAPGQNLPGPCPNVCIQDHCSAEQVSASSVVCAAGRCVLGFACDTSTVTCKSLPPACPAGQVPAVNGLCYSGRCVPPMDCASVTSCAACGTQEECVREATQLGLRYHCVTIPASCAGNGGCACLGKSACVAPFNSCADTGGDRTITCSCPAC